MFKKVLGISLCAALFVTAAYAAKGVTCETDTVTRCCETKWVGWRWVCTSSKECTVVTCSDGSGSTTCGSCN